MEREVEGREEPALRRHDAAHRDKEQHPRKGEDGEGARGPTAKSAWKRKGSWKRGSALLEAKSSAFAGAHGQRKGRVGPHEAEEKALSDRCDELAGESGRLRNDIEGLKGVKRGKEEVFGQMKSYGEGRKGEPLPFKQLINILKASKDNEQMTEKFFPREMEYHVLTEQTRESLSTAAQETWRQLRLFPKERHVRRCKRARRT